MLHTSYYLWSISHPDKNGEPAFDLSSDNKAIPILNLDTLTPLQLAFERIITKVFHHYSITLDVSDKIQATFKTKLWRMGRKLSTTGGKQRNKLLCCWKDGDESVWNFTVDEGDVNSQLMKRKSQVEELQQEMVKRQKLEDEVKDLKLKLHTQSKIISDLSYKKREDLDRNIGHNIAGSRKLK